MEKWKKETARAAVPVVLLWASVAGILWVALKVNKQPVGTQASVPCDHIGCDDPGSSVGSPLI